MLGRDLLDRLSPRKASRATRALKSAVNRRRVVIVVFLRYPVEYTLYQLAFY